MKAALLPDVFNGQLKSVLIAKNCFVLRAVIHKSPFYILHERDQSNIRNENYHSHNAFDERAEITKRTGRKVVEEIGDF